MEHTTYDLIIFHHVHTNITLYVVEKNNSFIVQRHISFFPMLTCKKINYPIFGMI